MKHVRSGCRRASPGGRCGTGTSGASCPL